MEVDSLFHGSASVKAVEVEGGVVPALLLVVSSSFLYSSSHIQAIDNSFHALDKPAFIQPRAWSRLFPYIHLYAPPRN